LLALAPQRRPLDGVGEEHLLREDQVGARVVGELVVVAHRDRVERAGQLAVAAEDAATHVDLVDLGVPLAGGDLVVGGVFGRDHPDALRGTGRDAERAAHALLEAGVLEAMELVAAAEAGVDGRLVLGVLHGDRALHDPAERGAQAAQGLPEGAVRAAQAAGFRPALDLDDVLGRAPGCHTVTRIAVTRALSVASGSSTFHPNAISWS